MHSPRRWDSVFIISDSWDLALLFAPLVYIAILGRRDEPTQRLVALVKSVAQVAQAIADNSQRRPQARTAAKRLSHRGDLDYNALLDKHFQLADLASGQGHPRWGH
jgi:hypothetical protein